MNFSNLKKALTTPITGHDRGIFLAMAVALVGWFSMATVTVSAQDTALFTKYLLGDTAQLAYSHATQWDDPALLIKYNPGSAALTKPSGTVQVTTTTLLFKSGLAGAEAADSLVTCPSGGTAGTILLTDAACDTIGEVVDIVNASTSDRWKAVNYASFRTDSTNDKFVAAAAASANTQVGLRVKFDTFKTLFFGSVLSPDGINPTIAPFLSSNFALYPIPQMYSNNRAVLLYADVALTGTTPNFQIWSVLPSFSDSGSSEVKTQIFDKRIVTATVTPITFGSLGLLARKGEKMLIRTIATTSAAAPYLFAHGSVFPLKSTP